MSNGFFSPLRYPGGKGKIADYIKSIIIENELVGGIYVEAYAGGAAVALELLLLDYVDEIHINDLNRSVHAFWSAVLKQADALCDAINSVPVTIDEWHKQKAVQLESRPSSLRLALSTFFLNRCNRSGILKGGVIGGKQQTGSWTLDARFNKTELINRIQAISRCRERITLHNCDAVALVRSLKNELPKRTLFYLDPPYYVKGQGLYDSFYRHEDHEIVAQAIKQVKRQKWIVSYDDVPAIDGMYKGLKSLRYRLSYSAQTREQGGEVMFFGNNTVMPPIPSNVPMHLNAA